MKAYEIETMKKIRDELNALIERAEELHVIDRRYVLPERKAIDDIVPVGRQWAFKVASRIQGFKYGTESSVGLGSTAVMNFYYRRHDDSQWQVMRPCCVSLEEVYAALISVRAGTMHPEEVDEWNPEDALSLRMLSISDNAVQASEEVQEKAIEELSRTKRTLVFGIPFHFKDSEYCLSVGVLLDSELNGRDNWVDLMDTDDGHVDTLKSYLDTVEDHLKHMIPNGIGILASEREEGAGVTYIDDADYSEE